MAAACASRAAEPSAVAPSAAWRPLAAASATGGTKPATAGETRREARWDATGSVHARRSAGTASRTSA
ncbi:hypothetical protein C6Q13_33675 [Burkholderia gladioli]|nr:hypothetical protein C6Q13_33675 [Burkholderia gladioli]